MARYIDADALEFNIFLLASKMTEHGQKAMNNAIELIRAMPTADVQPVIHGHWISKALWVDKQGTKHEKLMCNLCGFTHEFLDDHTAQYRYCTQCGAKMDEEVK